MSLDGFIAGPNGEYDWLVSDSAIDFAAIWAQFDTLLMGRRTFEVARVRAAQWPDLGHRWIVASRTLKPEEHPGVTILSTGVQEAVSALKAQAGKDIWLFGGGVLFRSLLDAGLVDAVDVTVMPVLLGSGTPLLAEGGRCVLHLRESKTLPSGILMLTYTVGGSL
jgi:dihydrofolate reductase